MYFYGVNKFLLLLLLLLGVEPSGSKHQIVFRPHPSCLVCINPYRVIVNSFVSVPVEVQLLVLFLVRPTSDLKDRGAVSSVRQIWHR